HDRRAEVCGLKQGLRPPTRIDRHQRPRCRHHAQAGPFPFPRERANSWMDKWISREKTKARNGLSNKGRAIFFPIADQINPSPAKATKPVPTMAPVSA